MLVIIKKERTGAYSTGHKASGGRYEAGRIFEMKTVRQKTLEERIDKLKQENRRLKEKLDALRHDKQSITKALKDVRKLLNEIPGAVFLVQDEKVILSNENAWRQLGYSEEEILSCDLPHLVHPRSIKLSAKIQHNWDLGRSVPDRFEMFMRKKDGNALCCEVNWKKIRFHGRGAYLINALNLEQRRREEKKMRQDQKLRALAQMASGLNWDFNRGLDVFKDQDKTFQDIRPVANKELVRSLRRFDAVLEIGDAISHRMNCLTRSEYIDSEVVLFNSKDVIREAVSITQPKWQAKGPDHIAVNTYLRTLSPILGHPGELRDALVMMIFNAVDAMPDGGEIYLTLEENAGYAWIYIQDDGMGIPEEIRDKIFDPFFTTKDGVCLGLGLSLADAIIGRHGGEIEFLSQTARGATFIVKIPFADSTATSTDKRTKNNICESQILIISDGNIATDLLTQMFVAKGGKVAFAYFCVEGLKLLRKKKFDLLVVDLDTPDFNLAGIIRKIRKMDPWMPIVILDVGDRGKTSGGSGKLDADLVIERPLEMAGVALRISEAIEKKKRKV